MATSSSAANIEDNTMVLTEREVLHFGVYRSTVPGTLVYLSGTFSQAVEGRKKASKPSSHRK